MSKAVVGALRVTLGLDSAQFTKGMKSAQTGLQRFAGIAKAGALAIGAAMVAAGGAMALAMKGIIDDADRMSKLSQSLGIPIEELSRLRYAAQLADVDLDKLEKSVRRLSAGMLDAATSGTGPAADAFQMLSIAVRDAEGNIRPATSVIEDLADRFARMPNGVEKTALSMKIFGKSGADMIPLLNEGSAGLREMYAEAEELGIVLDRETGLAAERFNDNLTRLGKVKDGIVTKITAGMLPALEDLTASLVVAAKDTNFLRAVGGALGWTLKALMSVALAVGGTFYALAGAIGIAAIAAYKWANQDFAGAAASIVTHGGRIQARLDSLEAVHQGLWSGGGGPAAAAVVQDLQSVDTAADGARRSTERLSAAQREAAQTAAELARAGQQTFEQTRTPAEQYAARVAELNRQLAAAAINQDTFNRAMRDATIAYDDANPLSQAAKRIAEENADRAEDAREEAIRLAEDHEQNLRAATYDGVRGGLEAAADGNLGQYLAQRIRDALFDKLATSLTDLLRGAEGSGGNGGGIGWLKTAGSMLKSFAGGLPGFKTGGSFKVGGSGGQDSQMMAFRATPGEMVDIRRPGQDAGGGAMSVHVIPSPYFDVQVEKVAGPVAARSSVQSFSASRQQVPADTARRRRFSLTGV